MEQVTSQPSDVSISVRLGASDVHWATMQGALNALNFVALLVVAVGVPARFGLAPVHYLMLLVLGGLFLFVVSPWIQAAISFRSPAMRFPFRHAFSTSGVKSAFEGGSLSLDWSHIRKARESSRYIGIWGKRGIPMVIPKSRLANTDLTALREILRSHLQNKAKLDA
jgi:hypothetical protein